MLIQKTKYMIACDNFVYNSDYSDTHVQQLCTFDGYHIPLDSTLPAPNPNTTVCSAVPRELHMRSSEYRIYSRNSRTS